MKEKVRYSPDKHTWHPSPLLGQIVLVTTLNDDGGSNVAPKSWVSMMAFEPPLLAVGCNLEHWTARNILRTGEFVVNVPGAELAATVWAAHELPHPRPVEKTGLTPVPAARVAPPLIEECRGHLECTLLTHLAFGKEVLLVGRIVSAAVDRAAVEAEDPYAYLQMLVFLEGRCFGVVDASHRLPRG